jgi:hypothetical protein
MADYRLIDGFDGVLKVEGEIFIPADPGNRDWQDYQAWLAEGNEPDPPPANPTPPIEEPPPPDIVAVNAQVQDIDTRLAALEDKAR